MGPPWASDVGGRASQNHGVIPLVVGTETGVDYADNGKKIYCNTYKQQIVTQMSVNRMHMYTKAMWYVCSIFNTLQVKEFTNITNSCVY